MEDNSNPDQNSRRPTKKLITLFKTPVVAFIILAAIFISIFSFKFTQTNKTIISSPVPEETLSPQMNAVKLKDEENKRTIKAFLSDLVRFPKFVSEVKPEAVKKALPFALNRNIGGWVVEVEKSAQLTSYYVLTPTLVKELIDPKSCVFSQDENPPIELEKVETIGADPYSQNSLQE